MATRQQQEDIRNERIEGVRTLQSLGKIPRDVDPVREEDAKLGAWPAGSLKGRAERLGLDTMPEASKEDFLNRGVYEESISMRIERVRGWLIGDDLMEAAPSSGDRSASVREQGAKLKTNTLRSYWENREELIETVKAHPGVKLGKMALGALVALDNDGRISQHLGDPRAKLAMMAAHELNAGLNNDPTKSRIARALSGEKEATAVVTETAMDFVPGKYQKVVKPAIKVAQTLASAHEKSRSSNEVAPKDGSVAGKPDLGSSAPVRSDGPVVSGPTTSGLAAQLNTYIDKGRQGEQDAAARQRRMTAILNGQEADQGSPEQGGPALG